MRPEVGRFLVGSTCIGAAFAVPWTLLSLYLDRLGFSKTEIGQVQAAESWGRALIALPAAFLLARRRTPPVLVATSLVAAAAYLALPWIRGLGLLLAVNLVRGLADSATYLLASSTTFFLVRPLEPRTS